MNAWPHFFLTRFYYQNVTAKKNIYRCSTASSAKGVVQSLFRDVIYSLCNNLGKPPELCVVCIVCFHAGKLFCTWYKLSKF